MAEKRVMDDHKIMANNGAVFTVGELRKFLNKERLLKPSDLFDNYDLLEDPIVKEAIKEGVEFELEYRDQQAEKELNEEMKKEKEEDETKDFDLLPEGSVSPSGELEGKKKEKLSEDKEGDLLPPGDEEDSESDEEDQGNEEPLLPG